MNKIYEPLTGKQIREFLPNATVIKYSELHNYNSLPPLPLIILYEFLDNFGHWCSVLKTPEGIEFFDSYGNYPDYQLNWVPKQNRKKLLESHTTLLKLLYDSGETINFNNYKFQGEPPIATCGRWCILRNMFDYLTTDQFYNTILKTSRQLNISFDHLVSLAI